MCFAFPRFAFLCASMASRLRHLRNVRLKHVLWQRSLLGGAEQVDLVALEGKLGAVFEKRFCNVAVRMGRVEERQRAALPFSGFARPAEEVVSSSRVVREVGSAVGLATRVEPPFMQRINEDTEDDSETLDYDGGLDIFDDSQTHAAFINAFPGCNDRVLAVGSAAANYDLHLGGGSGGCEQGGPAGAVDTVGLFGVGLCGCGVDVAGCESGDGSLDSGGEVEATDGWTEDLLFPVQGGWSHVQRPKVCIWSEAAAVASRAGLQRQRLLLASLGLVWAELG